MRGTPKIVMPRVDLIAALEARRPWADRLDRRNVAKHKRDEAAVLATFRKAARAALKWDYETLKEKGLSVGVGYRDRVECPASYVAMIDEQIGVLKLDQRKTITVSDGNENSRIFFLLTHDENAKSRVC